MHTRVTANEQALYQEAATIAGTSVANWVRETLKAELLRLRRRQQRARKSLPNSYREVAA